MVAQNSNVSIPVSVLQSDLSHGACRTYGLLSLLSTQNGCFWVSQNTLSNQLKCSTRHLRNFIAELEDFGFLENTGEYYNQHCVYRLTGRPSVDEQDPDSSKTAETKIYQLKTLPAASEHLGNIVPPIKKLNSKLNLINLFNSKKSTSEVPKTQAQSLMVQNPAWETEFQCFDGKEGRPSLLQKIEEALARFSYGNLVGYVQYFLKMGAKWLLQNLAKLHNLAPTVQPTSLEDLDRERREQDAKRRAYNNRYWPKERTEPTEEDLKFMEQARKDIAALRASWANNPIKTNDLSCAI